VPKLLTSACCATVGGRGTCLFTWRNHDNDREIEKKYVSKLPLSQAILSDTIHP